jgi:hypothetical protein
MQMLPFLLAMRSEGCAYSLAVTLSSPLPYCTPFPTQRSTPQSTTGSPSGSGYEHRLGTTQRQQYHRALGSDPLKCKGHTSCARTHSLHATPRTKGTPALHLQGATCPFCISPERRTPAHASRYARKPLKTRAGRLRMQGQAAKKRGDPLTRT